MLTETQKLPGLDGRKMSKSYGNAVFLSDTPKEIDTKISRMMTDPARVKRTDPGEPEKCPAFQMHKIYCDARGDRQSFRSVVAPPASAVSIVKRS